MQANKCATSRFGRSTPFPACAPTAQSAFARKKEEEEDLAAKSNLTPDVLLLVCY